MYYFIPTQIEPDFYSSFIDQVDEKHMFFLSKNNLLNKKIVYGVNPENISRAYELGLHHIILDYDSTRGRLEEMKHLLTKHKRL